MANMAYSRHKTTDIPQRNWPEPRLEELQRQIEFILGATKTGLDIIDSKYNLVYVDPAWAKVYGDYHGRKCYDYFMGKRSACPGCGVRKALKTKKSVVTEEILVKEDNRPIQVTTIPYQDKEGNWLVAEVNVDITERKKAEEELQESKERYRALIETTNTGYVIIDRDGRVLDANSEYVRLAGGRNLDEIRGRNVLEWTADYQKEKNAEAVRKCAGEGMIRNLEIDYVDAKGKITPVEINATVVKLGGIPKVLTLCRDITGRKKAEEELFRSKRLADIGTLAATVAHELRNPLATIRAAIFNIKRKNHDPSLESHLWNIEKKIVESNRIINDLLFYARIKLPRFEPLKLCDITAECVDLSQEHFKDHKVRLRKVCRIAKGTIIHADAVQLKELCHNILYNAYESFTDKKGTIEVKVASARRRGFVVISVKDNGAGMSAENLKRVAEPFFTTKVRGTGLGFSICHQIVRLHNGTMSVTSKEGKGTTVTVTLPVKQRKP